MVDFNNAIVESYLKILLIAEEIHKYFSLYTYMYTLISNI